LPRPFAADRDVAVSPARIGIGLPIVSVDRHELPLPAKDRPQAVQRAPYTLVSLQSGKANGLRAACPADQEGHARRQRGPEGRKRRCRRMEESDPGMVLLPECGAKAQGDLYYRSGGEFLQRLPLFLQIGNEAHRARLQYAERQGNDGFRGAMAEPRTEALAAHF